MILIIHLSDIHFDAKSNPITKRAEAIVAALRPLSPNVRTIIMVISGDIARTGSQDEYKIASRFLKDLQSRIRGDTKLNPYIILAPGNHDCDFSGDQSARQVIIDSILKNQNEISESFLQMALRPQTEYRTFRRSLENKSKIIFDDQLWTTHEITTDGFKIVLDAVNASWMSVRHEQQGGLIFPFYRYEQKLEPELCDLRICILHHPLNWFNQSNYRAFRTYLHRVADMILTGHEHQNGAREIEDADDGNCVYIEGSALQVSGNASRSEFGAILVNPDSREYSHYHLVLNGNKYESTAYRNWDAFRPLGDKKTSKLPFTKTFLTGIRDPGATLRHFSGRDLQLDDIFVYPDLDERSPQNNDDKVKGPKLSSSLLSRLDKLSRDVVIQGDDQAGKTKLLHKLASDYHDHGNAPILLRGQQIKSSAPAVVKNIIEEAIRDQYGKEQIEAVGQLPKEKKVILLDDFDLCELNSERKANLVQQLREHSARVLLTVGGNYQIAEFLGEHGITSTSDMQSLRILPLGHAKRLELIRKWNRIGISEAANENDFLKTCDDAEKLIEDTKLRYVASSVPIFILSLLQAASSGVTHELHNSSFAHYYYFLIVGALEKAKVAKGELGSILAICSHLAWFIRTNGFEQTITHRQLKQFVAEYSQEWTDTNAESLLSILTRSNLMEEDGESIKFTYPYSYYYFLGKYASNFQLRDDVVDYIAYCLENLYARECANTLLFLAHHSGNSAVLDALIETINGYFSFESPATLHSEDIASIRGLLAQAPTVKFSAEVKPNEYRDDRAQQQDNLAAHDGDGLQDSPAPPDAERDLFQEIVGLSKAIEIAGVLLNHQFANYDRTFKNKAISSLFDASMRAVKSFHTHFENVDDLLKSILDRVQGKLEGMQGEKAELFVRNAIAYILRMVTTSFVMRAGQHLSAKQLDDNVIQVIEGKPTNANRLIGIARALQGPGRLPRVEVDRLRGTEDGNPAVMGVLQLLIVHRLYMYETEHSDKDWAMGVFRVASPVRSLVEKRAYPKPPKSL